MKLWSVIPFLWLIPAGTPAGTAAAPDSTVAAILRRQTQELLDAITAGDSAVWQRYLDPDVSYTTEDGVRKTKREMVAYTKPLPKYITGDIPIIEFTAQVYGDVAVTTHVDDEHEVFRGHKLHCQYRSTDTWRRTPAGWRLIGSQILALRTDPPAVTLDPATLDQYVGRYHLTPDVVYQIRREGAVLLGQETGRKADTLKAEVKDVLFVPGRPRYRMVFRRDRGGRIVDYAERREAWDLVWTREGR